MNTLHNDVSELALRFCPYEYSDLGSLCSIGDDVWLDEYDLFDIVYQGREKLTHSEFENIDPVAILLQHILEMARAKIKVVTAYNFINDYSGSGIEIRCDCHSINKTYTSSEKARQALKEKVSPHLDVLRGDKWCRYFLSQLAIRA